MQRAITLKTHDIHSDPLMGTMLRNCYMLEGAVLFDLRKYKEAIEAYSNVSSLYPDEPFVLETFVQIANCWRRLDKHDNARGAVKQAQIALGSIAGEFRFRQHNDPQPRRVADAAGKYEQVVMTRPVNNVIQSTEQLAALIAQKHEVLVQLRAVGVRQTDLVAGGEIAALLKLLGRKATLDHSPARTGTRTEAVLRRRSGSTRVAIAGRASSLCATGQLSATRCSKKSCDSKSSAPRR